MKNLIEQIQKGKANGAISTIESELKKRILVAVTEERKRVASLVFEGDLAEAKFHSLHYDIQGHGFHYKGSKNGFRHYENAHGHEIKHKFPTGNGNHSFTHTGPNGKNVWKSTGTGDTEIKQHMQQHFPHKVHQYEQVDPIIEKEWLTEGQKNFQEHNIDHPLASELYHSAIHDHEHAIKHGYPGGGNLHQWADNYRKKMKSGKFDEHKAIHGLTHAIDRTRPNYFGRHAHQPKVSYETKHTAAKHLLPHVMNLVHGKEHHHGIDESVIREASAAAAVSGKTGKWGKWSDDEKDRMPWPKEDGRQGMSPIAGFSKGHAFKAPMGALKKANAAKRLGEAETAVEHPHAQAYRDWLGRKAFWRQSKSMSSNGGYRLRSGEGKSSKAPWSDAVKKDKRHQDHTGKHNTAHFHKAAREWAAEHEPHLNKQS